MKSKDLLLTAMLVAVLVSSGILLSDGVDTDAETVQEDTYYCYGDRPMVLPIYPGDSVWDVRDIDGDDMTYTVSGTGIQLDLSNTDKHVIVTQTVGSETAVITLIPMHITRNSGDGEYSIKFHNGDEVIEKSITASTVIREGDPFVTIPAIDPIEGMAFGGWYTDEGCTKRLDTTVPIESDMDVYAKWSSTGSQGGGTHTVVVNRINTVTFDIVNGLRYDVIGVSGSEISFTVTPLEGFDIAMSDLHVESTAGTLIEMDGYYRLSGINRDAVVTISGDVLYTVEYNLRNASVSVPGFEERPGHTALGTFDAKVSSSFGWSGLDIKVYMNGKDVTSSCVGGSSIHLEAVTGNIVIVAESPIPWLYILIAAIVIVAAVVGYILYRRKEARS